MDIEDNKVFVKSNFLKLEYGEFIDVLEFQGILVCYFNVKSQKSKRIKQRVSHKHVEISKFEKIKSK